MKKLLFLFLVPVLAFAQQQIPTPVGGNVGVLKRNANYQYYWSFDGSQLTNLVSGINYTNADILYVDKSGNDSVAIVGRPDKAWLTLTGAIASASVSNVIQVGVGEWYCPNIVTIPVGVVVRGLGNASVLSFGDSIIAGLRASDNCVVENIRLLNTNQVAAVVASGDTSDSATNVLFRNVSMKGISDCFYWAPTNYSAFGITFQGCRLESEFDLMNLQYLTNFSLASYDTRFICNEGYQSVSWSCISAFYNCTGSVYVVGGSMEINNTTAVSADLRTALKADETCDVNFYVDGVSINANLYPNGASPPYLSDYYISANVNGTKQYADNIHWWGTNALYVSAGFVGGGSGISNVISTAVTNAAGILAITSQQTNAAALTTMLSPTWKTDATNAALGTVPTGVLTNGSTNVTINGLTVNTYMIVNGTNSTTTVSNLNVTGIISNTAAGSYLLSPDIIEPFRIRHLGGSPQDWTLYTTTPGLRLAETNDTGTFDFDANGRFAASYSINFGQVLMGQNAWFSGDVYITNSASALHLGSGSLVLSNAAEASYLFESGANTIKFTSSNTTFLQPISGTIGSSNIVGAVAEATHATNADLALSVQGTNVLSGGGTAGQVLTATAAGSAWSNAPAAGSGWTKQLLTGGITAGAIAVGQKYAWPFSVIAAASVVANYNYLTTPGPTSGYLSNLIVMVDTAHPTTTNVTFTIATNVIGGYAQTLSAFGCTLVGGGVNNTNTGTLALDCSSLGVYSMGIAGNTNLLAHSYAWSVEWWHQ